MLSDTGLSAQSVALDIYVQQSMCVRRGRTYEKAAGGTGSLSGPGEARSDLDLDVQAVSLLQLVQWLCRRGSFT